MVDLLMFAEVLIRSGTGAGLQYARDEFTAWTASQARLLKLWQLPTIRK